MGLKWVKKSQNQESDIKSHLLNGFYTFIIASGIIKLGFFHCCLKNYYLVNWPLDAINRQTNKNKSHKIWLFCCCKETFGRNCIPRVAPLFPSPLVGYAREWQRKCSQSVSRADERSGLHACAPADPLDACMRCESINVQICGRRNCAWVGGVGGGGGGGGWVTFAYRSSTPAQQYVCNVRSLGGGRRRAGMHFGEFILSADHVCDRTHARDGTCAM